MGINKENSAPARLLPSEEENPGGGPISGGGGAIPYGINIVWESNAAHTTYLDATVVLGDPPPFQSGGGATGRFRIEIAPATGWKAFKYWVEDETANSGEPLGYFYSTIPGQNDVTTTPLNYDLTVDGFTPPAVVYVSSYRHEKRILKIEPYTAVTEGVPSGTPLDTISIPLSPPAEVQMTVTMEAPDGRVSSRWRKVSFATNPIPRVQAGTQVIYNSGYITSPTRIKTDSFLWLNNTGRYVPSRGREVYLVRNTPRSARTAGSLVRPYPRTAWGGQAQWRRVMEVGNTGGFDYGYVEYEYPFDPPIAADDAVYIVDNCVMVNVQESPFVQDDAPENRFEPTLGPIFIDTWGAYHNINNTTGFLRSIRVQAYVHAANYPEDGDYEYTDELPYQATTGASFPKGEIREVTIPFEYPPRVYSARLIESISNTGKLVAEIVETLGEIGRWRMYARTGGGAVGTDAEWPTLDGTKQTVPLDEYLVIDEQGLTRQVETSFDLSAVNVRAIFVCQTIDGESGPPTYVFRAAGPETTPQIMNVRIKADDISGECRNRITWTSRNVDSAWGFRIEHHREDHRGMSHGENPTAVILTGTAITVDTGEYVHAGNTAGAYIDSKRNFDPFTPLPYRVSTHHYDFWTVKGDGNEIFLGRFSRSDAFIVPFESNVSLGTLSARLIYDTEFDAAGRVVVPITIALSLLGARNLHYTGESTGFAPIVQYEFSDNVGVTWHPIAGGSQRTHMQADRRSNRAEHKIWDYKQVTSGGFTSELLYRAFYIRNNDGVRRALVMTSTPLVLQLAYVTPPGP